MRLFVQRRACSSVNLKWYPRDGLPAQRGAHSRCGLRPRPSPAVLPRLRPLPRRACGPLRPDRMPGHRLALPQGADVALSRVAFFTGSATAAGLAPYASPGNQIEPLVPVQRAERMADQHLRRADIILLQPGVELAGDGARIARSADGDAAPTGARMGDHATDAADASVTGRHCSGPSPNPACGTICGDGLPRYLLKILARVAGSTKHRRDLFDAASLGTGTA